jgi:imidazolonepropionase-like amidohydrolase
MRAQITRAFAALILTSSFAAAQVAVKADVIHTVSGTSITDGVVVVTDGKIVAVGRASEVSIPAGHEVIEAKVLVPGFVDVRATVGLTGIYNGGDQAHDQDMIERSAPIQPGLRAIDAYNPREALLDYVRSYGVTTIHTGHAPGALISGQTMIAKTRTTTVADAVINPFFGVAATLSPKAQSGSGAPGTRGKTYAMLREALIGAEAYKATLDNFDGEGSPPARDLAKEALVSVLKGDAPLIVTANQAQDIASALRLQKEFSLKVWLDMAAEVYTLMDEVKAAGVPVLLHPTTYRATSETKNLSFTTAAKLADADIPFAIQTGFEGYVPKVRVLVFEAAIAAAHGLGFERTLESITLTPAKLLGISERVGSIEVGKDGDLALFDGDPFEYTTHCTGVVIEGEVASRAVR